MCGCYIDNVCYYDGQPHPDSRLSQCNVCNRKLNLTGWTALPDQQCNDNDMCTHTDTCRLQPFNDGTLTPGDAQTQRWVHRADGTSRDQAPNLVWVGFMVVQVPVPGRRDHVRLSCVHEPAQLARCVFRATDRPVLTAGSWLHVFGAFRLPTLTVFAGGSLVRHTIPWPRIIPVEKRTTASASVGRRVMVSGRAQRPSEFMCPVCIVSKAPSHHRAVAVFGCCSMYVDPAITAVSTLCVCHVPMAPD